MSRWTAANIPELRGRRAVVTGATSGLGLHTALELARHRAAVTLAVRDTARGETTAADIRRQVPGADVRVSRLDLADLASVRSFAAAESAPLHLLVNNAGVMALPHRTTADGFEMQLGTNHLGHFALTGLLLPALLAHPGARVVTVSSGAHRIGAISFDDLQSERRYRPWVAYGQSKLANLLFAAELARRAAAAGVDMRSVAAHPGYAATNLQSVGPAMSGNRVMGVLSAVANRVVAQPAAQGALPTLYAATAPGVVAGDFVGPDGLGGMRGYPTTVGRSAAARDTAAAARLWTESERLTGVGFQALAGV